MDQDPEKEWLPAIDLAIKHVNRDDRFLRGYELEMTPNDAQVGRDFNTAVHVGQSLRHLRMKQLSS